jgi:hypothetical protein
MSDDFTDPSTFDDQEVWCGPDPVEPPPFDPPVEEMPAQDLAPPETPVADVPAEPTPAPEPDPVADAPVADVQADPAPAPAPDPVADAPVADIQADPAPTPEQAPVADPAADVQTVTVGPSAGPAPEDTGTVVIGPSAGPPPEDMGTVVIGPRPGAVPDPGTEITTVSVDPFPHDVLFPPNNGMPSIGYPGDVFDQVMNHRPSIGGYPLPPPGLTQDVENGATLANSITPPNTVGHIDTTSHTIETIPN